MGVLGDGVSGGLGVVLLWGTGGAIIQGGERVKDLLPGR